MTRHHAESNINKIIDKKSENENMACKYYSNEQFKKLKKDNQDKNISITFKYIFSTLLYR